MLFIKIDGRCCIRAALNSFAERIYLGGSICIEPRMSENITSTKGFKIYELMGLNKKLK